MKKKTKIIISILGGLYGTTYIISFYYWLITADITLFAILSVPILTWLIGSVIYLSMKYE